MFKALAIGAPYVNCIAMARAPITAAMKAKYIGDVIENKTTTPSMLKNLGFPSDKDPKSLTLRESFVEYDNLERIYKGRSIPPSAVGVYTYFASKLGIGLKQLLAGVRKFKLDLLDRQDVAYISQRAQEVCSKWKLGIKSQESIDFELVKNEIYSGNY
jgi:hypothetical protein